MNIFHKVTLVSLKKNRTRTVVTIIGIILSAAMICGVTTFVSSMQNYLVKSAVYNIGAWHAEAADSAYETYQEICASDKVKDAVYAQQLGYAYAEGCINKFKPYLYVLGASEGFEDMLSIHITAGRYPASGNEILLPEHLASNGGVRYKIGDTVTLELGNRVSDGYILTRNNPLIYSDKDKEAVVEETLEIRESRTYTVVGFYERLSWQVERYDAPGYTAITIADTVLSENYLYDTFFIMNNPKEVFGFFEGNGFKGSLNSNVLMYQGASRYNGFYNMLYGLAAIIVALIMFGSVSLIYNAFSISVSERTKQFGLLSSVGATRKQLRKMVFFEALVVGAIGIPVGVAAGVLGIAVTLFFIGNKFMAFGMPIKMGLYVSPVSILIAVVVAFVTVIISAWIPSKRATKVSAVEAIRQNMDIKITKNSVKTSKLTYRVFGLPGMLAGKHFKRNRKKYRATVMSLFMSIVLFVSASAFCEYLMESVTGGFGTNGYDLSLELYGEEFGDKTPEEVFAVLETDKDVDQVTYAVKKYFTGRVSAEYLNENVERTADDFLEVYGYIYFVRDDDFAALLRQYHLDENRFMDSKEPLGIAIDGTMTFNRKKGKYTKTEIFGSDESVIKCHEWQGEQQVETFSLKTGKIIYETPYYIQSLSQGINMIYPIGQLANVLSDNESDDEQYYRYFMTSGNHDASYQNIKSALAQNGMASRTLYDYAKDVENDRNQIVIIQVLSYGFIVLISLIAAANVFNTISTNISLRRREFAMLQSVGMTAGGLRRMMNYECLLYGSKSLLFGLPAACVVTYLIYRAVLEGYETNFRLPYAAIGIAVLSVFLVVFATMMYSMKKLKTDNLIDDLKNENI